MKCLGATIMNVLLGLLLCGGVSVQAQSLAGEWHGTLVTPTVRLRIVMRLVQRPTGEFDGTVVSPDESPATIPLSSVVIEESRIRFSVPQIGAAFDGAIDSTRTTIDGTLTQQGVPMSLTLTRDEHSAIAAAPHRPQTPQPPYPYREEFVSYPNPASGFTLGATLTLPPGQGPFPAVLLVTGSGAQDRDETLFEHRPFLVLADALTRRGIAVLRADDRGVGASTGTFETATTADFTTDAAAGIAYLRARSDVDTRHIGILGHSEGGVIAPSLASQDAGIAFVVMLAGPAVRGDEIIVQQVSALARAQGAPDAIVTEASRQQRQLLDLVMTAPENQRTSLVRSWLAGRVPDGQLEGQLSQLLSPWYRAFLATDPATALRRLRVPVLAMYGGKDLQVTAAGNAGRARELLAGNPRAEVVEFPQVNHLFQTAGSGLPLEYGQIEETMAPAVIEKIVNWIQSAVQ
ncbi:MAG: alpha/beta fold hydrolase [Acidobacteriaceae bacterium]|jgi:pimeloyl-ACP methyl ester carboxylesterase|nr:alpha/beta fold hydrolase [Acidobacteriaceae bacterium]